MKSDDQPHRSPIDDVFIARVKEMSDDMLRCYLKGDEATSWQWRYAKQEFRRRHGDTADMSADALRARLKDGSVTSDEFVEFTRRLSLLDAQHQMLSGGK